MDTLRSIDDCCTSSNRCGNFENAPWKERRALKDRSRFSKSRAGTDRKAKLAKKRSERSSRTTTRCTPRDLLSASIPLANPLAIWEEPTRAARHRGEIGREAGALSLSASASLPPPPLLSRRRCHKVTRSLGSAGFTRAGVRTFDRSVGRSVGRGFRQ